MLAGRRYRLLSGIWTIDAILSTERPAPVQVVLKHDRLKQYFPQSYTAQQMEKVIVSLLEKWHIQNST